MEAYKVELAIEVVGNIKREFLDDWENRSADDKLTGKMALKSFFDVLFADGLTESELSHILTVNGINSDIKISRPDELAIRRLQKINKATEDFIASRWV